MIECKSFSSLTSGIYFWTKNAGLRPHSQAPKNWSKYTKHNYAVFNKYHTWTEYINRLTSVLAGFVFLFLISYTRMYLKPSTRWPCTADIMGNNRFERINHYLHFCYNNKFCTNIILKKSGWWISLHWPVYFIKLSF